MEKIKKNNDSNMNELFLYDIDKDGYLLFILINIIMI